MNIISIIGRLVATPELKTTPTGKSVCNITVAVDRKMKGQDGNPVVDYIDCVAWNKSAEFLAAWFTKGVRIGITGEMQTRVYEKDGKKNKVCEVLVNTVEFADGKKDASTQIEASVQAPKVEAQGFGGFSAITDDNLPF